MDWSQGVFVQGGEVIDEPDLPIILVHEVGTSAPLRGFDLRDYDIGSHQCV